MLPLSTFTLESLVAFRQWSAEQRLGKKKTSASKSNEKNERAQVAETKVVKSPE